MQILSTMQCSRHFTILDAFFPLTLTLFLLSWPCYRKISESVSTILLLRFNLLIFVDTFSKSMLKFFLFFCYFDIA